MKQLNWLLFLSIGILNLLISACVAVSQTDTAVAQAKGIIEVTLTPTAFPTPFPDMPRPDSCPITRSQSPRFVPPEPYSKWRPDRDFWYGSNELWTLLRPDGTWQHLPKPEGGYRNKVFWWREGYSQAEEPQPDISMIARRLDGKSPEVEVVGATNGYHKAMGAFMLSSIELPTFGCWEVTGEYKSNTLSFVVWVAP